MYLHSAIILILLTCSSHLSIGAITEPKDASELANILAKARSGDTIQLSPITYTGEFLGNQSSDSAPITIRGTSNGNNRTTFTNPNGTVWRVIGSRYIFRSFLIVNSEKGMEISGSGVELDAVTIKDCVEGILISSGEKTKLQALTITNVERGVVIQKEANHVILQHSSITSGNVSLEIQPESCCSVLDNNVFNGPVNLFGNGNKLTGNVGNGGMLVTGCFNQFTSNIVLQMKLTKKCENPDKGLNIFQHSPDQSFE